jgi:hypothetical protein
MSNSATTQDIVELQSELKESFADITSLLQVFMQQVDDRFNHIELEQKKTVPKSLKYLIISIAC